MLTIAAIRFARIATAMATLGTRELRSNARDATARESLKMNNAQEIDKISDNLRQAGNRARSLDMADILEACSRTHRTEKQNLGCLVFALLQDWASDFEANNFDLRNEETCERAHKMITALPKDERHFFMPYI